MVEGIGLIAHGCADEGSDSDGEENQRRGWLSKQLPGSSTWPYAAVREVEFPLLGGHRGLFARFVKEKGWYGNSARAIASRNASPFAMTSFT